jgi:hypothetical protein
MNNKKKEVKKVEYKLLSKENREDKCNLCGDLVYEMAFVKTKDKQYFYTCYDCIGEGTSRRAKHQVEILEIDESRMAREEVMEILLSLAEEDEDIFKDLKLTVVKSFKDEILEGVINEKLENYIRFNGNDIGDVLKIRSFAIEANKKDGIKYRQLVDLYKHSRIKKLTMKNKNELRILMSDRDIQLLDDDYKLVWDHILDIRLETQRDSSIRRYDNLDEIKEIIEFLDKKKYMTENQLKRMKSFYYEMLRRNKKKVS